jgi:hypothetical protein
MSLRPLLGLIVNNELASTCKDRRILLPAVFPRRALDRTNRPLKAVVGRIRSYDLGAWVDFACNLLKMLKVKSGFAPAAPG